jgi:hypothetical protein
MKGKSSVVGQILKLFSIPFEERQIWKKEFSLRGGSLAELMIILYCRQMCLQISMSAFNYFSNDCMAMWS